MRLFPLFLRQTPVGDCTSSEEVPDAWSLSPSDPIFRFSWTISGDERREKFTESTGGWQMEQVCKNRAGCNTRWWLQQERKTLSRTLLWLPLFLSSYWLYQTDDIQEVNILNEFDLDFISVPQALWDKAIHHGVIYPRLRKLCSHSYTIAAFSFPPGVLFIFWICIWAENPSWQQTWFSESLFLVIFLCKKDKNAATKADKLKCIFA